MFLRTYVSATAVGLILRAKRPQEFRFDFGNDKLKEFPYEKAVLELQIDAVVVFSVIEETRSK